MKNLILSTFIATSFINPLQNLTFHNTLNRNSKFEYEEKLEFDFSHSKHWVNGKLISGRKDYSEELMKSYQKVNKKIKDLGWENFKITDFKGYLAYDNQSPINFSESTKQNILKILTSKNLKVDYVYVDIQEKTQKYGVNEIKFFTYDINYSVEADGKKITDNLSVYNKDDLFSESNFLSPYRVSLKLVKVEIDRSLIWQTNTRNPAEIDNRGYIYIKAKIDLNRKTKWFFNHWDFDSFNTDFTVEGHFPSVLKRPRPIQETLSWKSKPEDVKIPEFKFVPVLDPPTEIYWYLFSAELDFGSANKNKEKWTFDFTEKFRFMVRDWNKNEEGEMTQDIHFVIELFS